MNAEITVKQKKHRKDKNRVFRELQKNKVLYLMCLPALILLIMFCYIPFAGTWMAFTEYKIMDGIFGSKFVGLDNFKYFFSKNSMGMKAMFNTLYINFFGLVLGTIIPITIAILLNEIRNKRYKKLTQSMMFFPYFLSWVVVGAIIYGLFSADVGVANSLLSKLGLEEISWYSQPKYWKPIIVTFDVWKWSGYNSIIYMAAMANFDGSLYEAAKVDGANKFQRIISLTLPMLKPTAIVLILMSIGRIFYGDFGMIYGIVGNNPILLEETSVIDTYVYQTMRSLGFSYATAIGLFQSVMGLILVTISNRMAKRVNEGEGLF
ncbi:MAG: ABC transporter permease subunit [Mobilitalea sp.]